MATLMLISPNGVINVKAADIETGKQQSANSSSDKIDELAEYLANDFKNEYHEFRYVGWQDDLHDMNYFWQHTKTGKCIKNLTKPSKVLDRITKEIFKSGLKLSTNELAKKIASYNIGYSLACQIAKCYLTNHGK